MTRNIEQFIEANIDLIDIDNWKELQEKAYKELKDNYHEFNAVMLSAGINPMKGLEILPWKSMMDCPQDTYDIPDTIRIIDAQAFQGAGFSHIKIPEGVEQLNFRCFAECPRLKEVYLPSTVKTLKGAIFMHCPQLEKIVYNGSSEDFNKIDKAQQDSPFTWYTAASDLHRVKAVVDCDDKRILIGAFGR